MAHASKKDHRYEIVKIERNDGTVFEGMLLPSPKEDVLVVKLGSGYNIGVHKDNIKNITELQKGEEFEERAEKENNDPPRKVNTLLPKISILTTGGTIASRVDYRTGGVSADIPPEEFISHFPLLTEFCNPQARMINQMMSESFRFGHYNLFAQEILKEIQNGAKGVIIAEGTDTLHYTSAALSFILENIPVPILVIGSQRSSDRPSTDAYINIMNACYFIAHTDFKGVGVCMHENTNDDYCIIMPGCKVRKMHTSRRDAFRPINVPPIAKVHSAKKEISYLSDYPKEVRGDFCLREFNEHVKVGIIKAHTHMHPEQFEPYVDFDGVIFEGTGIGQFPNGVFDDISKPNEKNLAMMKRICDNTVSVWAPQTIYGRTDLYVYSEGRLNLSLGMSGNYHDMTPETAFIKLAWLLSNYSPEETKKLIGVNLRGEISERSTVNDGFLR